MIHSANVRCLDCGCRLAPSIRSRLSFTDHSFFYHIMSTITLQDLQTALVAVQRELNRVKSRLDELEKVVTIENDSEGIRRVYLECTDFVIRPAEDQRHIAVHLGSNADGGYIHLHYPESSAPAVNMGFESSGDPHLQLKGRDFKPRIDLFIRDN